MKLLYKILKQDPNSREGIISATSTLGIIANLLIALIKVVVGIFASSIAIVSEGVNNASDALTSVLTLLGAKLSQKHPDEKHPFGYGRVEYLTGLVIAILILVTGVEMLQGAIERIFQPGELNVSYLSLIIVAASAVIKFALGAYTVKMGKKADSSTLEALGVDSKNDSFASAVTIVSALVFLVSGFSIDAYAGAITSLLIIKAGIDVLRETVGDLLGRSGDKELAKSIYKEVRETEGVIGAADMMLHNYGPDAWSGSVNVEMDHNKTVGEIYQILHKLQLRIMKDFNTVMVFGVYAVDNDHEYIREVRKAASAFIGKHEHVKSFHAVYLETGTNLLYCDLIVDYSLRDWDELDKEFKEYMAQYFPDKEIVLTIETEFV